MPSKLRNPITISGSTGVTISNVGSFDGLEQFSTDIDVGNDISLTGSVTFAQVTASMNLGGASYSDGGIVNGAINIVGATKVTSNLFITGSVTSSGLNYGSLTADSETGGTTHLSGSNIFGDDLTDKQYFSGSVSVSSSFSLNKYEVDEISNDVLLSDSSTTALATESGSRLYAQANVGTESGKEDYMRKNFSKAASSISNNTASFSAVTASAPSGLTATSENDFIFFINGSVMEHDAITIQQSGDNLLVIVNSDSIGYNLEQTDSIRAWGRFDA